MSAIELVRLDQYQMELHTCLQANEENAKQKTNTSIILQYAHKICINISL